MEQEQSIRDLINQYENDICYFQQMQIYSMPIYEKNYYSEQIRQKTNNLIMELEKVLHRSEKTDYISYNEGNNFIRNNIEDNESVEKEYDVFMHPCTENEFIFSSQPNMENEFFLRPSQETEEEFTINPETNDEVDFNTNTEPFMEKTFTLEELAEYNGINGNPPYVAVNGIVYDMSAINPWAGGTHFGLKAGNDLSAQFIGCHRGAKAVLDKLTPVGVLVQ